MKPESQDYPEKGFQTLSCPRLLSYPQLLPQLFALGPSQFLFISCSPGPLSLPILLLCKLQPMLWPSHFLSRWLCPPECRHDCPFSVCVGMGQVGGEVFPGTWYHQCLTSAFAWCLENCCKDTKLLVPFGGHFWHPWRTRENAGSGEAWWPSFSDSFQQCFQVTTYWMNISAWIRDLLQAIPQSCITVMNTVHRYFPQSSLPK